jgi:hypothetical protein
VLRHNFRHEVFALVFHDKSVATPDKIRKIQLVFVNIFTPTLAKIAVKATNKADNIAYHFYIIVCNVY